MFNELNNQELEQIYTLANITDKVKKIISQECEIDSKLVLQDHAFGEYWNRKLQVLTSLNKLEIESITKFCKFPTATGVLGEAARRGMLNKDQCDRLLKIIPENVWAFKTIKSRKLLFEFLEKSANTPSDITNILNQLIKFKTTWAILELLPHLNRDELLNLKERMTQKTFLNKGNRHLIRESIDKIIKKLKWSNL